MVALDILHKLLAEDEVVVAKMNPVNDYLGPLLREVGGGLGIHAKATATAT